MRPHKKKKRSEWATKAILFLASLAATLAFGLITPNQNTPWVIVVAFCAFLQLTIIVAAISIPAPPDPRELTQTIFRGKIIPDEDDEERERQRQNDQLGFNSPDRR